MKKMKSKNKVMKNLFLIFLFCVFSISVSAQKRTTTRTKQTTPLVTKAMADKIGRMCLYEQGYGKTIFFTSNSEYLSFSDIAQGKGTKMLQSLSKYPKCSENFIYAVYQKWGTDGWKQLGFTADEIAKCKKIVAKKQSK